MAFAAAWAPQQKGQMTPASTPPKDAATCAQQTELLSSVPVAIVAVASGPRKLPEGWTHKLCPGCRFIYPRSDYPSQTRCRQCRAAHYQANKADLRTLRRNNYYRDPAKAVAKSTAWKRANPDRYADYGRRSKYGLQPGQYARMLEEQNGLCLICRSPHPKPLHVDHCHATGKVRALLCDLCNRGLGYFQENPDRLASAIKYLREHQ
ncbi:endonuclease VII domain-containing protein [Streptomyces sp. NPDC056437]|uniref:endonuclease VII domain-containing protein n=1 Tax=Streptomyces sp. NPDC056437 TaxID=3345816 RepID=UPI0036A8CF70